MSKEETLEIKRGDIFYADLSPVVGSEQGGTRPVLIVQNNIGNRFSPTVIVAAITSKITKAKLPTHIAIPASKKGLEKDSVILAEQLRTIDKQRLQSKVTNIEDRIMDKVDYALEVSLGTLPIHNNSVRRKKQSFYQSHNRNNKSSKTSKKAQPPV